MGNSASQQRKRHERALEAIPRLDVSELEPGDLVFISTPQRALYGAPVHSNVVRHVLAMERGKTHALQHRRVGAWNFVMLVGASSTRRQTFLIVSDSNGLACYPDMDAVVAGAIATGATVSSLRLAALPGRAGRPP